MEGFLNTDDAIQMADVVRLWTQHVGLRLGTPQPLIDDIVVTADANAFASIILVGDANGDRLLMWISNQDIYVFDSPAKVRELFLRALAHFR